MGKARGPPPPLAWRVLRVIAGAAHQCKQKTAGGAGVKSLQSSNAGERFGDTTSCTADASERTLDRSTASAFQVLSVLTCSDHSHLRSEGEWSGWPDSNWRPPAPKAGALTRLRYTPTSSKNHTPLSPKSKKTLRRGCMTVIAPCPTAGAAKLAGDPPCGARKRLPVSQRQCGRDDSYYAVKHGPPQAGRPSVGRQALHRRVNFAEQERVPPTKTQR